MTLLPLLYARPRQRLFAPAISAQPDNAFCLAKNLKLRSSAERLANWIHEMHRRTPKRRRLDLAIDKKTLALRLGMTPENLARGFAHLRAYGVRVEGRTIWIEDPNALQSFADPTPFIDEPQV
jgi:CRP/FNR family transcriptional activator FtrB